MKNERKFARFGEAKDKIVLTLILLLEVGFMIFIGFIFLNSANAVVGQNVTVITRLEVGNVFPEIINLTVNGGNSIDLTANGTTTIMILAHVRDYNGDSDLNGSRLVFFDNFSVSYTATDDNNNHYSNNTCYMDKSYGDAYTANITCFLSIWYYANNATWNVTLIVNDTYGYSDIASTTTPVNQLIALGLPDVINYGIVNSTNVSNEIPANVTNFGNVRFNLSLEGYAVNRSDGLAMNCTLGTTKNISIGYEKYNLTASTAGSLNLTQFEAYYLNLTNVTVTKTFNLNYRQNDTENEAINASYWRIYVPKGVAGNCSGNIIFGATKASGT